MMYMTHLECPKCGWKGDPNKLTQLCPECGAPLLVRYDLARIKASVTKEDVARRSPDLWRYRELLPLVNDENKVTLGEGMTPLVHLRKYGAQLGIFNLYLKDESIIPSGTFKSRGAAVGVSRAKELGVKALAMPTNGNAGASWAIYCAKADIAAYIVMPEDAPPIPRGECAIAGAKLFLVKGLISDAGKIVGRAVAKHGWMDASTLKEPYRIEGKKTMGLEIAEQMGWEVPDVILYPTGGGVGLIGIYKALCELKEMGWIADKMPRFVAVQASGCAPVVKAWEENKPVSEFWNGAQTVAFGITVPKALGDFLVLDAIYKTNGCAVAVDDAEILRDQAELAAKEGLFICPEGAANITALKKLIASGWVKPEEKVVMLNTGTGLKYPDTVKVEVPVLQPTDDLPLD
ncbi:MAG: threonine synthase [Negativicutes bacterium]|nr:threonine synthase [Negativicutes bacterium]